LTRCGGRSRDTKEGPKDPRNLEAVILQVDFLSLTDASDGCDRWSSSGRLIANRGERRLILTDVVEAPRLFELHIPVSIWPIGRKVPTKTDPVRSDEQAQSLQLIEDSNLNDYSGFARFAMPVLNLA
jgi:hypothetical protein